MQSQCNNQRPCDVSFGSFSILLTLSQDGSSVPKTMVPEVSIVPKVPEVPQTKVSTPSSIETKTPLLSWSEFTPSQHSWEEVDYTTPIQVSKKSKDSLPLIKRIISKVPRGQLSEYEWKLAYAEFLIKCEKMEKEIEAWLAKGNKLPVNDIPLNSRYNLMWKIRGENKKQKFYPVAKPNSQGKFQGKNKVGEKKEEKKEEKKVVVEMIKVSETETLKVKSVEGKVVERTAVKTKVVEKKVEKVEKETKETEEEEEYYMPVKNSNFIDFLLSKELNGKEKKENKKEKKVKKVRKSKKVGKSKTVKVEKKEETEEEKQKEIEVQNEIIDCFIRGKQTEIRFNMPCQRWVQGKKCFNPNCGFVHKVKDLRVVQCRCQKYKGRCLTARAVNETTYENYGPALTQRKSICSFWHQGESLSSYFNRFSCGFKKVAKEQKNKNAPLFANCKIASKEQVKKCKVVKVEEKKGKKEEKVVEKEEIKVKTQPISGAWRKVETLLEKLRL